MGTIGDAAKELEEKGINEKALDEQIEKYSKYKDKGGSIGQKVYLWLIEYSDSDWLHKTVMANILAGEHVKAEMKYECLKKIEVK